MDKKVFVSKNIKETKKKKTKQYFSKAVLVITPTSTPPKPFKQS